MFTITEKSSFLYEKVKFLTSPNPSRHHRLLLIFYRKIVLPLTFSTLGRGGSRTAATSKVELSVIIFNGWKPLTIITISPTLDVAVVLDQPLLRNCFLLFFVQSLVKK